MRVLHVLASNGWGGAERIACTLHRLGVAHGHTSMLEGPAIPELVAGVLEDSGERLPASRVERLHVTWALAAGRRRRGFRPDIVHAHFASPGLAMASWIIAGSTPFVGTFHLLPRAPRWPKDYFLPVQCERVFRVMASKQPRHAFVVGTAADLPPIRARFPGSRTVLIVNAPPLPPVAARNTPSLPFQSGVPRLLSVGRLNEQKGLDRLIRALADPAVAELPWHWVIVGEGPERSALERLVADMNLARRVTFVGHLPANGLFEQADLVLSPSRFEGTSLVPQEALLAGRPVLASRIPPHIDLLGDLPGALLPENDAEWPRALRTALADHRALRELRQAHSRRASGDPREELWRAYQQLYEQVLGGS